jgi:hypothetical protein
MKPIEKIKRQRYNAEMKIIQLEEKLKHAKLSKNELKELEFLKKKTAELEIKIASVK